MEQGEQRHHESGRAKAALRTVKVDQGLLHRMQPAFMHKVFDADEVGAIGLADQCNAGIDRDIDEAISDTATQHDRTGSAIPLGATFLCSGGAFIEAKIVENGKMWRGVTHANDGAPP